MTRIAKNVPIPPPKSAKARWPIGAMEVGDSILMTDLTQREVGGRTKHYVYKKGWKFATRKVKNGVRGWRIQ